MSKSKILYEKKVEIARDYLEGRVGYTESLGRANNSKLLKWCKVTTAMVH